MSFSVLAGFFGSLASVLSKTVFSDGFDPRSADWVKLAALAGFVASNGLMMLCFKRALASSKSSATTLALNMASNFIFTALFSMGHYGETLTRSWWFGAALILAGSLLIELDSKKKTTSGKKRQSHRKKA